MDKYYTQQPFANQPSMEGELAHDPGNSSHWTVPHPAYALPGSVDLSVYQSTQLYPVSSQRSPVHPDTYLYYESPVRASPHSDSLPQQLPREPYHSLGQDYYPSPYYPAFASLPGTGTYESTDSIVRDEGM